MDGIDANSPRQIGVDFEGIERTLGDSDSDGYFIGYIDEEGICWESRREHDLAKVAGNYHDAFLRWTRTGGLLGAAPDPRVVAIRVGVLEENFEDAVQEALWHTSPKNPLNQLGVRHRAQRAIWN